MTRGEFLVNLFLVSDEDGTDGDVSQALKDHDQTQRETIAEQRAEIEQLEAKIARLREALELYKNASYQSHNGHWDMTMQGGVGCPECIRARELRVKADEILAKDALKETT